MLVVEGKALGRDLIVRLVESGVKPSVSGDLWSDGGMIAFSVRVGDAVVAPQLGKDCCG